VKARAVYKWVDQAGAQHIGEGRTLNISESGALVSFHERPPDGAKLQLTLFLPLVSTNLPGVTVLMDAKVVRIEEGEPANFTSRFAVESSATRLEE
jgi:PilZ domain